MHSEFPYIIPLHLLFIEALYHEYLKLNRYKIFSVIKSAPMYLSIGDVALSILITIAQMVWPAHSFVVDEVKDKIAKG